MCPSAPQGLPWVRCMAHSMLVAPTDVIQGCVLSCLLALHKHMAGAAGIVCRLPPCQEAGACAQVHPMHQVTLLACPHPPGSYSSSCCCPAALRAAALESRGHWSAHG